MEIMPMKTMMPIIVLASLAASCGAAEKQRSAGEKQRAQPPAAAASDAASVPPRPADPAPDSHFATVSVPVRDAPNETLSEAPFSAGSAQAAANVLQAYYALVEEGKYEQARRLRWDHDAGSAAEFAAQFADYAEYHATVGAPKGVQAAAGSSYVEVPVQLYGRKKNGDSFGSAGTVTLRRANDVPGATAAQRRWRIYTSE
ncbi:MAG: hypothetical protein JWN69_1199 [Alphaproteobacteria bacterium]|nr:hypothetical protein [Alphaproteobacteria bacterium]